MNPMLEFMVGARHATKLYEKAFDGVRIRYGMTQLEIDILAFLKNNPELDTASDIVNYRKIPKANVSQAVELLIRKGCLQRRADERDRRRIHLMLKEETEPVLDEILRTQRQFNCWLFQNFTGEEREQYMEMSRRLFNNIKDGLEKMKHGKES